LPSTGIKFVTMNKLFIAQIIKISNLYKIVFESIRLEFIGGKKENPLRES